MVSQSVRSDVCLFINLLLLFTLARAHHLQTLPGHNSSIDCVKFAYSDDFVYSADDTGVIKRWNLNASDSISLFGHMKSVRTLDFYPYSDSYLVSGSNDTSIRLWDVREKVCIKRYRGHMSHVNSVKFSPDGSWIASAGAEARNRTYPMLTPYAALIPELMPKMARD
uniref:WD_REPEATS_REGION domain-containing protein n=1 Tax=Anopheles melas TaxID=34690 RepID=A0A182TU19_9DIPT